MLLPTAIRSRVPHATDPGGCGTAPFVDIEFFRRAGSGPDNEERIARRLEKIKRLWPD